MIFSTNKSQYIIYMMSLLKIDLMGPFQVFVAGAPVNHFATSKSRALLAYLAVERSRQLSREHLAGLLWPEYSQADALHNLRLTLSRLRHPLESALREANFAPEVTPLFFISRQSVSFHPAVSLQVDIHDFEELLSACDTHPHGSPDDCHICMQYRIQAVNLYRGDFLEGFSVKDAVPFEEWAILIRERLHHRVLEVLQSLTHQHLVRAHAEQERSRQTALLENALRYARQQLLLEPWRESAHRQLMTALVLSGQIQEALTQFQVCRQVLAEEFGIEPNQETVQLHQKIVNGELTPADRTPITIKTGTPNNLPPQIRPLIDREAQLHRLKSLLFAPDYRWVTLIGESGVGKTSLALTAIQQVMNSFPDGVWYVPLGGILLTEDNLNSTLQIENILATSIGLAIGYSFSAGNQPRQQLLEFLREKRLLLLLDDFDLFAGAAGYLLEIIQTSPYVSLIVTSRQLRNFQAGYVMRIDGFPTCNPAEGSPSAWSECIALFESRFGETVQPANYQLINHLCQLVDGWPYGIELIATQAKTRPLTAIASDIQYILEGVHASYQDLSFRYPGTQACLESIWDRLQPEFRQLLMLCSLFKTCFDVNSAIAITQATQPELDSLVEIALLNKTMDGWYELPDLISQLISQKLLETEADRLTLLSIQKQFSGRASQTVSSILPRPATALQVPASLLTEAKQRYVRYYLDCLIQKNGQISFSMANGHWTDFLHIQRAWQWALDDGDYNLVAISLAALETAFFQAGLFHQAKQVFQTALNCLIQQGEAEDKSQPHRPALLSELHLAISRAALETEDTILALHHAESALSITRLNQDLEGEITALCYLGKVHLYQNRPQLAEKALKEALGALQPEASCSLRAELYQALGQLETFQHHLTTALQWHYQALDEYTQLNDAAGEMRALISIADLFSLQFQPSQEREALLKGLEIAQILGDLRNQSTIFSKLATVYVAEGALDLAKSSLEKALSIAEYLGERARLADSLLQLAAFRAFTGDPWQARNDANRALKIARADLSPTYECRGLIQLALACCQLGDFETGQAHSRLACHISRRNNEKILLTSALVSLGRNLEAAGEWREAKETYEEVVRLGTEFPSSIEQQLRAFAGLARVHWRTGKPALAVSQISRLLTELESQNVTPLSTKVEILAICWQVLSALREPQMKSVAVLLHQLLSASTSHTNDENLKRSFFENIPGHREAMAAWQTESSKLV